MLQRGRQPSFRLPSVQEARSAVAGRAAAPCATHVTARRQRLRNLTAAVNQIKQVQYRDTLPRFPDQRDAGCFAAGVEFDAQRL
jgi:hypothetical protein